MKFTIDDMRKCWEASKKSNSFDEYIQSYLSDEKNYAAQSKFLNPLSLFIETMKKYEDSILPSLLSNFGIIPSNFSNLIINDVKRDERILDVFNVNPKSVFASIIAGAEIGLIPSSLLGEFYLIPKKDYVKPMIGYKGLVKILLRDKKIEHIEASVVYKGDDFNWQQGTTPKITHKPKGTSRTADDIEYVYCIAFINTNNKKSGKSFQFTVMTRDELLAVKRMSNNELYFNDVANPNRWMEKKACLIQLSKLLDKDYYGSKAIEIDNKIESGSRLTIEENKVKIIEVKNKKNALDLLPK